MISRVNFVDLEEKTQSSIEVVLMTMFGDEDTEDV